MLTVDNVHAAYGAVTALRGVTLAVEEGELVGIVGVNGAGKSTLLKVISGVVGPTGGTVTFLGKPITNLTPEAIARLGIALVPEGRHVFPSLTVAENLRLGAATRKDRAGISADLDEMCQRWPILGERINQSAGTLSGGEQQQLVLARALMSRPKLVMLDEPSLGLAPILVDGVFEMVGQLRDRGVTVLLVEQNVRRTLDIVDRAYLLATGSIEFSGQPADLLQHADIEAAYLGGARRRPSKGAKHA
jgi:branched-chain amino acid transport system ATP-binding protein